MVHSKVGQPVVGSDFFNRKTEQQQLWQLLREDNVLLLAPRRVGKTSLMRQLRSTTAQRQIEAAYCTVEGATSEEDFVNKLFAAIADMPSAKKVLAQLTGGALGKFFKRIKKVEALKLFSVELERFDALPENRWELLGNALFDALEKENGRRLLLVDELPIFILALLRLDPSGDRARHFLSWLREQRQRPGYNGWLRWLLAGSIGLDTVAARMRLGDTINDLALFRLGAFDPETADQLLRELATTYSLPLDEPTRERILARVGWLIPFYLQLVFRELKTRAEETGTLPSPSLVDSVFEELMSPAKRAYFDYWRQRLHDELGQPDAGLALDLLGAVAQDPAGTTKQTLSLLLVERIQESASHDEKLRYLLDVLQTDGYLVEAKQRYRFRSPLLREYWLRRVIP